jgi:hypothetical protein
MDACKRIAMITAVSLAVCVMAVAQDERTPPPVAATVSQDSDVPSPDSTEATPDTRPLTGIQPFTLGSSGTARSFLLPSVHFMQSIDTNVVNSNTGSAIGGVSSLSWNLDLQRMRQSSQTTVQYAGGKAFYQNQPGLNADAEQLGITQLYQFRRMTLTLTDNVSYVPDVGFAYTYLPTPVETGLIPGLTPAQSILTTFSSRVSNTVAGQLDFALSARTSITTSGSFGILRFPNATAVDSNQGSFQLGLNRSLDPTDTVGLSYGVTTLSLHAPTGDQRVLAHNLQVAYGRRITGRMALRLSGGPQIRDFRNAIYGASSTVSWTITGSMSYQMRRAMLGLSYGHVLSGGSGVLIGADSDIFQASIGLPITRTWSSSINWAYSHNTSLLQFATGGFEGRFSSEVLSVHVRRPLTRQLNAGFSYTLLHQSTGTTGTGFCSGSVCASSYLRHAFGIGIDWQMRPILIGR